MTLRRFAFMLAACLTFAGKANDMVDTVGRRSNMIQDYYLTQFRLKAAERRARLDNVRTKADAEAYRQDVRKRLAESFGPFPEKTPLNPRITGQLSTKKLLIDKVVFESRPGFQVTGLFYRPKQISGKIPGILALCGHSSSGKNAPWYQDVAQSLALRGYGVLMIDPIGQGERRQFTDAEGVRPGVFDHNMRGKQLALIGEALCTWRLWDAIRGLDYLLTRPEIDAGRIGVTGTSGGGTLSTYLNAFDSRLTMAAPSCYITTQLRNLENELPADAEQNPPRLAALGCDMADFLIAAAPRPALILAQDNDFFDPRGTQQALEDARKIYTLLGKPEQIQLFTGKGDHGYSAAHREAAGKFFNRYSGLSSNWAESPDIQRFKVEELNCTPNGQVGGRDIHAIMQELEASRRPEKAGDSAAILRQILQIGEVPLPDYRVWRTQVQRVEPLLCLNRFGIETEPGIVIPLKQLTPSQRFQLRSKPRAILFIPHLSTSPELKELGFQPDGKTDFFCLEVRGIGESRPAECNIGENDFFCSYGSDFLYASCAHLLDRPYQGRKVYDILAAVRLLKKQGAEEIHLIGNGQGSIAAALAAVFSPDVKQVTLYHAPLSWRQMVNSRVVRWPFSAMPHGILRKIDLPDVYRDLRSKNIRLIAPWDAAMRPCPPRQLSAAVRQYRIPCPVLPTAGTPE